MATPGSAAAASVAPNIVGQTVPVLVAEKTFYVHESVLTSNSEFFKNAMKPEWRTDPTKPIQVWDEEGSWRFEKYTQWLYSKTLPADPNIYISGTYDNMATLYVFGDKIMDEEFQKAALQMIAQLHHSCARKPGLETIRMVYEETNVGSPARRLMVDMCAWNTRSTSTQLEHISAEKDPEFMKNLVKALITVRDRPCKHIARPWAPGTDSYWVKAVDRVRKRKRQSEEV